MNRFEVGNVVSFLYPAANYLGARLRYERRLLRIDRVLAGPAPQEAVDADPLLVRDGPLVVGTDACRHGAVRSFYAGRMRDVAIVGAGVAEDRTLDRRGEMPAGKPAESQAGMESLFVKNAKLFELFVTLRGGGTLYREWQPGDKRLFPVLFTNPQTGESVTLAEYGDRRKAERDVKKHGSWASVGEPISLPGA